MWNWSGSGGISKEYNMKRRKYHEKIISFKKSRMLCGVCGGVGEYFNIDPTLVRLGMVLLAACSFGTGVLAYFIAAVIIPDEPSAF